VEQFCKLPGGELCVFGLADASKMTQITATEWQALVPSASFETDRPAESPGVELLLSAAVGLFAGVACAFSTALWRWRPESARKSTRFFANV
jgi:hypothetical protein